MKQILIYLLLWMVITFLGRVLQIWGGGEYNAALSVNMGALFHIVFTAATTPIATFPVVQWLSE